MFAKLQEMTNEHVEKFTGLFPKYRNLKQKGEGKQNVKQNAQTKT